MNTTPSYQQYSLAELYDVLAHMDSDRYPERKERVLKEIRQREGDTTQTAIPEKTARAGKPFRKYLQFWRPAKIRSFMLSVFRGMASALKWIWRTMISIPSRFRRSLKLIFSKPRWLSGIAVLFVAVILLSVLNVVDQESAKKEHKVYRDAFYFTSHSPQVIAVLGEPIEAAFRIEAQLPENSGGGPGGGGGQGGPRRFGPMNRGPAPKASYKVPISGPNGQALLIAEAEQVKGNWEFIRLEVEIAADSTVLDLIDEELPPDLDDDNEKAAE